MPVVQIAPVTRRGMRFLINLYGMGQGGKTLSALLLAAGLEPDPAKRGHLDTEGGQRGRMYVDDVPGGYLYGSLTPPFTPERYIEALADFEAAGVNVLVVDSASHVWFAEGGVLDLVEQDTTSNEMAKWRKPKRRLGKMTRRIFSSDMHIILCCRGRQPLIDNGAQAKPRYTKGEIVPVMDQALYFDITVQALMTGGGRFTVEQPAGKCPGPILKVFQGKQFMSIEMGAELRAWAMADGGLSPEHRKLEIDATEAAEGGVEHFRTWYKDLEKAQREFLRPRLGNFESISKAADEEAKRLAEEQRQAAQSTQAPFTDSGAAALSDASARAATDLRACQTDIEFDKAWAATPVEICRELGAPFVEQCKSDRAARAEAQGKML